MAKKSCTLFATLVSLSVFSLSLGSSIPVLAWWKKQSTSQSSSHILAGHTISRNEFQSFFAPFVQKNEVFVVALQDMLSVDDFTRYGGSFPFIRSQTEGSKYVFMPSVTQHDGSIVDYLSSIQKTNIIEISLEEDWNSYDITSKLKDGLTNLVVVRLEPVMGSVGKAKESILLRNDKLMKKVSSNLSKASKSLVMLYTSESPAQDVQNILINEELESSQNLNSRHLLADTKASQSGRFASSKCVALYLRGLEFGVINDGKNNLTDLLDVVKNETEYGGECNAAAAGFYSIILKTDTDKDQFKKETSITINLQKINNTLEWGCHSIEVKGEMENGTATSKIDESFDCGMNTISWKATSYNTLVSPLRYSFACKGMEFFNANKTFAIAFKGIQIQPFEEAKNGTFTSFYEAYNCEGFFTLPILTGLLVGGLLILSLFLGTTMMMNIQTQDRFDDPKGKTITVAAQE